MPIHPIGAAEPKGTLGSPYAVRDYRAINPAYGTAADFRALVQAVHARGMKLILDWVPNHTAPDHAWVRQHPDWYFRNERGEPSVPRDEKGKLTDWTDVVQLDYGNPAVRREMIATMRYWLEEFGIDGFRVDVAGFIPSDFWREAMPALRAAVRRPILLLAEWGDLEMHRVGFDLTYGWDGYKRLKAVWAGEPASSFVKAEMADMQGHASGRHADALHDQPRRDCLGRLRRSRCSVEARARGRPSWRSRCCRAVRCSTTDRKSRIRRSWRSSSGSRSTGISPGRAKARTFYQTVVKLARTEPGLVARELEPVTHQRPRRRDRLSAGGPGGPGERQAARGSGQP